jgi:hypothetical protein
MPMSEWARIHVSVSAAQAEALYREVVEHSPVWEVRGAEGFPAPEIPRRSGHAILAAR